MPKDTISIAFKCPECGVAPVTEDNPTDASLVKCESCGRDFGTYGEVKAKARKLARSHAIRVAKRAFKKR